MGTKVHYRSCFWPHDTMRDLNVGIDNSWSPFYINKTLNVNFNNGYFLSPSKGYSEYDKEMLKRTMLEHEAIFRKQVYELHRLYSIQKDLMAEFQMNSSPLSSKNETPSKTISYTSQVQSEYATRTLQISHLHATYNGQKNEKSRCNDHISSPINFFERNWSSSSGFHQTEALQRVADTDASFRKCPKALLGLRLPEYGYVVNTEILEEFPSSSSLNRTTSSRISNEHSDIELKPCLTNCSSLMGKDVCELNYHNKSPVTGLILSYEASKDTFFDGASDSLSLQVSVPRALKEENHGLSFSPTRLTLQNTLPKDMNCSEMTFSNVFQIAEETSRGTKCYNESGKLCPRSSSISYKEKNNSVFCEPTELNDNKVRGIISTDFNEESSEFVHEESNHFQIRNSDFGNLPSVLPNSLSSSLNFEKNLASSPQSWMELAGDENHASMPFSAIPSFKGINSVKTFCRSETPKVHNAASGSSQVGSDLNSPQRIEDKSFIHLNDLNNEFLHQSHSTSQLKFQSTNINLNEEAEILFSEDRNSMLAQQNEEASGIGGKFEEPSSLSSKVDVGLDKFDQVYYRKIENVRCLSSCNFKVFSSTLHDRDCEIKVSQLSDSLSTAKFIGINEPNLPTSSNDERLAMDELRHVSMSHDIKMYCSEKLTSVENNISNSRNIDLNSVFSIKDDIGSSDNSTKAQTDFPLNWPDPISVSRAVTLNELEAPVNSMELCSHDMLIKEAAENIVKLSSDGFKEKKDIRFSQSVAPSENALYLFAEMVLSDENILKLNDSEEDGFDLFEQMNLQLEEMKPEKLWCRPREVENTEIDKRSKASILLAKPRRAQGRKRRQRKDFQKDILPALTTLSRQETTKDLQAIGELMKAAGTPWQVGTRRRKTWRKGAQPRASRKCRQVNASASIAVVQINPPTALFMADGDNDNLVEVDRHDIIGWGRTTRRCRSQRSHSLSISATLT